MSERKFSVGDKVRIVRSHYPERVGLVVTIVSDLVPCRHHMVYPTGTLVHQVDLPAMHAPQVLATYVPSSLVPVYDGNERVSWSECIWKPKQVAA